MKTPHFIAMRNTWILDQLAQAYLKGMVRFCGVSSSIDSDRATRFRSGFWHKLQEAFWIQYSLSPRHGWANWANSSNPRIYALSMRNTFQTSFGWAVSADWVLLQQQLPCQHRDDPLWSAVWSTVQNSIVLAGEWRHTDRWTRTNLGNCLEG